MSEELDAEALAKRLAELREEEQRGQQVLAGLENEAAEVRSQLLRISGAIQVLEELTGTDDSA